MIFSNPFTQSEEGEGDTQIAEGIEFYGSTTPHKMIKTPIKFFQKMPTKEAKQRVEVTKLLDSGNKENMYEGNVSNETARFKESNKSVESEKLKNKSKRPIKKIVGAKSSLSKTAEK